MNVLYIKKTVTQIRLVSEAEPLKQVQYHNKKLREAIKSSNLKIEIELMLKQLLLHFKVKAWSTICKCLHNLSGCRNN